MINEKKKNAADVAVGLGLTLSSSCHRDADLEKAFEDALRSAGGNRWSVLFRESDGYEYSLRLSEIQHMGNKSARDDEVVAVLQCVRIHGNSPVQFGHRISIIDGYPRHDACGEYVSCRPRIECNCDACDTSIRRWSIEIVGDMI